VSAPFLFLIGASLKNRVRRRLGRLRQPRYLLGMVAGVAYLYMSVVRNQMRTTGRNASGLLALVPHSPEIVTGGAVLLWLGLVVVWLWPFPAAPWTFTGPEVHFFFTAPVTRRRLLSYKLLRGQVGVLFGVLIASFFSGAARAALSGRWSFVLGGWLFFAALQLHTKGAALTKSAFRAPARRVPVLAWASAALVVIVSGMLAGIFAVHLRDVPAWSLGAVAAATLEASKSGIAAVLLWPFGALVRPVFAATPGAFAQALGPVVAILAVNYSWVISSDSNLEDAAAASEKRKSERRAAPVPTVTLPVPFSLAPSGRPETAVLWKNTILLGRYFSIGLVVRVLIPLVVLAVVIGLQTRGSKAAPLFGILALFTMLVGPYMVRNDLRHDMPRLPVLKTWPVAGRQLLVGELLAPTVVLTAFAWFLLLLTMALARAWPVGPKDIAERIALAVGVAVVAPMVIAGQVFIQNAAVVLFPGWIATGGTRARGIEAMGQNMLMFFGTMLALAVGVLPAAAVASGLGFLLWQLIGWSAVLPAAIVLAGLLGLETWLVVGWLGRVLDRTEPAAVEVAE
jgi:ABC-2 type transport system permease protein